MRPSLPIDITVASVGRIHRRSGVHRERERRALVAMLHELPKLGFRGLVVQVQRGERQMLEVYAHYVANTLAELGGPKVDRLLEPLLTAWLDTADVAESTRQQRRDGFAALKLHARRGAVLAELPGILAAYRATDGKLLWQFDAGTGIMAPPVAGTNHIRFRGWRLPGLRGMVGGKGMTDASADPLPLAADFPAVSRDDWRELVDVVLKGAPFERLIATAHGGLRIEPLYSRRADAFPVAGRASAAQGMLPAA